MVSAFARDCYFRAGLAGIALRFPVMGWFGRYRILQYDLSWEQIKQLVHFTHRVNLIPVARELRVELTDGKTVVVQRRCFSHSIRRIQAQLQAIRVMYQR